jgi:hypothetical protein
MKTGLILLGCAALVWCTGANAADKTPTAAAAKHNHVCIDVSNIDHTSFPNNNTILFYMNGGPVRIWKNSLPRTCQGLTFERGIAYEIRGGSICSNMQVVYVINRWIPCFLGPFTPYTPPQKKAAGK